MKNETLLEVAKLGKTVGLKGELKLHFLSDFPEQFKKGVKFKTQKNVELEVKSFNKNRLLICFVGFDTPEKSQKLVNSILLTTKDETRKNCILEKNQFFWFDIIGCEVYEDNLFLGSVEEIERFSNQDYLQISTTSELIKKDLPKSFLIPYIDKFIIKADIEKKLIHVKDGLAILENS